MYIGHFSFFGDPDIEGSSSGFFSCVADADDADSALNKFADLIEKLKDSDDLFEDTLDIFLDSCTELHSMPEGGFLDFYIAVEPEPESAITTALRGATPEQATAFYIGSETEGGEDEEENAEPFISFGD